MRNLNLSSYRYGDHITVALHGELDLTDAAEVADAATAIAATAGQARIVIDLAGLTFIDCSGLRALVQVMNGAREAGGDLLLAAPHPRVRRILALTGLVGVLSVYPSVEEAERSNGQPRRAGRQPRARMVPVPGQRGRATAGQPGG